MPARFKLILESEERLGSVKGTWIQAAFLELVAQADPDLAEELHACTAPPLYGVAILPDGPRRLVMYVGFLRDEDLGRVMRGWLRRIPHTLKLGGHMLPITRILASDQEDRETGVISLDQMAERARAAHAVELDFHSPVFFRSPTIGDTGFRPVRVFPSPERVFSTLARRVLPLGLVWDGDLVALGVDEVGGQGEVVTWEGEHRTSGFVGLVRWRISPQLQAEVLGVLLGVGSVVGVGSRTTQGCGHMSVRWR